MQYDLYRKCFLLDCSFISKCVEFGCYLKGGEMLNNVFLIVALLIFSSSAMAEGIAVSGHLSAQGGGVEAIKKLSERFNARLAYHEYGYKGTDPLALLKQAGQVTTDLFGITKSENAYDHNGNQKMWSIIADWYPDEESQARVSFGLGYNKSQDDIAGREQVTGGYRLGAHNYSAGQVGTLSGTLSYDKLSPYIGYGWGNPVMKNKDWGMVIDFGFYYEGAPNVTLNASGAGVSQADVLAEKERIRNDTWKWSPTISVGASYQW